MTRVIHTGDTHIGYRQYHSPERRADFRQAFDRVIADAIDLEVDAVVHAGDLFHDTRPDLGDLLSTLESLRALASADIPLLAIVGNHERTRDRQWIDLFAELDLAVHLDEEGTVIGDVTFYGLDYIPHSQRDAVEFTFEPPETSHTAVVAHGLFEPFAHAEWDTASFLDRLPVRPEALLLGDNHEPGQADIDGTLVTYCGSTERTSATEEPERGYNVLTFGDDHHGVHLSRRSVAGTREFEYIPIELAPGEGIDRIAGRIAEQDVTDAVVIVRIDGDGQDVPPATVEELALDAGALVARVNDRRERQTTDDHQVNFADPSRAIDERLRSMGLSQAGHDVESIIRDDGIADANVRDRATERVRSLLSEEPGAFEPGAVADDPAPERESGPDDPNARDPDASPADRSEGKEAPFEPVDPTAVQTDETETDVPMDDETESTEDEPAGDEPEDQRSLFEYR